MKKLMKYYSQYDSGWAMTHVTAWLKTNPTLNVMYSWHSLNDDLCITSCVMSCITSHVMFHIRSHVSEFFCHKSNIMQQKIKDFLQFWNWDKNCIFCRQKMQNLQNNNWVNNFSTETLFRFFHFQTSKVH